MRREKWEEEREKAYLLLPITAVSWRTRAIDLIKKIQKKKKRYTRAKKRSRE